MAAPPPLTTAAPGVSADSPLTPQSDDFSDDGIAPRGRFVNTFRRSGFPMVEPVFYIKDAQQSQWFVALRTKARDTYEMGDELSPDHYNDISNQSPSTEADEEENWNRSDVPGVIVEYVDDDVMTTMSNDEV
ncbi:hypothetical protein LINPERPRIM_LOCUS29888 [Linum perenne]